MALRPTSCLAWSPPLRESALQCLCHFRLCLEVPFPCERADIEEGLLIYIDEVFTSEACSEREAARACKYSSNWARVFACDLFQEAHSLLVEHFCLDGDSLSVIGLAHGSLDSVVVEDLECIVGF